MLQLLQTNFWLSVSIKLRLSIRDSKLQISNLYKRIEKGDLNILDLSDDMTDCLELYIENYDALNA